MNLLPRPALRRPLGLLVAAGLLAAPALVAQSAAAAVTVTRTCPQQLLPCTVSALHTVGSVTGTIDKVGLSSVAVPWTLSLRGVVVCHGTYRPADPMKRFACAAVPPGPVVFSTPGTSGATRITLSA